MSDKKKVLFFCPYGTYTVHNQLDAVIATALRLRGVEVLFATCDGTYRKCEVLTFSEDPSRSCQECAACGTNFFSAFEFPQVRVGQALTPDDFKRAEEWVAKISPAEYPTAQYGDLPIGKWSTSSVFSYFRIKSSALARPEVQAVHRQYLMNSLLTFWALERITEFYGQTHMVVFNGRMAPYRAAFEFAKLRGLPVLSHDRAFVDDTFLVFENFTSEAAAPLFEGAEEWGKIALSAEELESIKRYFDGREQGQLMNLPSYYSYLPDYATARHQLRIPLDAKVMGVFTSSEFELAYNEDFQKITTQLELIRQLIEQFRGRDEYLVIRHHPHLAGNHVCKADDVFLSETILQAENLPPNVRVIQPQEKISSYALLRTIDAAIVPFSTICLEAVNRGVPAATYPQSPFSQALGHTLTPEQPERLPEIIDRLFACSVSQEDLRRLYRFTNMYINKISLHFRSVGIRDNYQPEIRIQSTEELLNGSDVTLERVCRWVLDGSRIALQPTELERMRSQVDEDAFLPQCLLSAKDARENVRKVIENYSAEAARPPVQCVVVAAAGHVSAEHSPYRLQRKQELSSLIVSPKGDEIETLREIIAKLSPDTLCVIASERVLYCEGFLTSAEELFAKQPELQGIRYGAWGRDNQNLIRGEYFSVRLTGDVEHHQRIIRQQFHDVWEPLSLVVWKPAALNVLLDRWERLPTTEQRIDETIEFLCEDFLVHERVALVILPFQEIPHGAIWGRSLPVILR